jgi:hypothetical protein
VTNASDSGIEKSVESCERWEWFGGGLVVVGLIAEVAIAALHPPYDSFWEQWGSTVANSLVALGVVFEIKFGQMAGLRQSELRRRSDDKVAAATDRAAQAEAELARITTPRTRLLTPEATNFQKGLGVSKGILAARLRELVARGVLEMEPASDGGAYQDYVLTAKGRDLFPLVVALRQWGEDHCFRPGERRSALLENKTGRPVGRLEVRSKNGRKLAASDTTVHKPAGPARRRTAAPRGR